eukprot:ctg_35.g108
MGNDTTAHAAALSGGTDAATKMGRPVQQAGVAVRKPVDFVNVGIGAGLQLFEVTTLGQPFEVIKTHLAANRNDSLRDAIRKLYARGGLPAFWTGLIPWAWIEASTKGGVLMLAQSEVAYYAQAAGGMSPGWASAAGGMAGGICQAYTTMGFCTFMKTVEVTRTRAQPGSGTADLSTWQVARNVIQREGIIGLYKGANAVALRQLTNWGVAQHCGASGQQRSGRRAGVLEPARRGRAGGDAIGHETGGLAGRQASEHGERGALDLPTQRHPRFLSRSDPAHRPQCVPDVRDGVRRRRAQGVGGRPPASRPHVALGVNERGARDRALPAGASAQRVVYCAPRSPTSSLGRCRLYALPFALLAALGRAGRFLRFSRRLILLPQHPLHDLVLLHQKRPLDAIAHRGAAQHPAVRSRHPLLRLGQVRVPAPPPRGYPVQLLPGVSTARRLGLFGDVVHGERAARRAHLADRITPRRVRRPLSQRHPLVRHREKEEMNRKRWCGTGESIPSGRRAPGPNPTERRRRCGTRAITAGRGGRISVTNRTGCDEIVSMARGQRGSVRCCCCCRRGHRGRCARVLEEACVVDGARDGKRGKGPIGTGTGEKYRSSAAQTSLEVAEGILRSPRRTPPGAIARRLVRGRVRPWRRVQKVVASSSIGAHCFWSDCGKLRSVEGKTEGSRWLTIGRLELAGGRNGITRCGAGDLIGGRRILTASAALAPWQRPAEKMVL